MKKALLFLAALAVMAVAFAACGPSTNNKAKVEKSEAQDEKGVVKVLYFHGAQRCATCVAIEEKTKELLQEAYVQAQQDGKVKFCPIDFSESEGEAIADSYEVAFSSLLLDKDGTVVNLTDMAFRYAHSEPETFNANLMAEIDKLLE